MMDRERYPKNHANLLKQIELRKVSGVWNETDEKFRSEISYQRGGNIAIALAFLAAVFGIRFFYQRISGEPLGAAASVVIFVSLNLLTLHWRRRLLQRKCPNCGQEFGHLWGTDQRTVVSGRCPQCDYKAVT